MSFDSTFDYTSLATELTNKLESAQVNLDAVNTAIADTNAITGFDDVKNAELAKLIKSRARYVENVDGYNNALDEIDAVELLSTEDKAILYGFYAHQPLSLDNYKCTIAHSHPAMIVDAELIALVLNANGLTAMNQRIIGTHIASRYGQNLYC